MMAGFVGGGDQRAGSEGLSATIRVAHNSGCDLDRSFVATRPSRLWRIVS